MLQRRVCLQVDLLRFPHPPGVRSEDLPDIKIVVAEDVVGLGDPPHHVAVPDYQ